MTPKVLWVFFFFFLLKIICLLLHATGQISSFKTKVQQGQETPPPHHLYLSPIQKSFCRHRQDYRYKVTKSTSEYIVCHGRITNNSPPKKGFNFPKIKESQRIIGEQTEKKILIPVFVLFLRRNEYHTGC